MNEKALKVLRALGIVVFVGVVVAAAVIGIYSSYRSSVILERIEKDMPQNTAKRVSEMMPEPRQLDELDEDEIVAKLIANLPECASADSVGALLEERLASTPITGVVQVEFPECLSICPEAEGITPTVTPTTTVSATLAVTPTTILTPTCKDIYFDGGDINVVPAGFVIAGDVDVWYQNQNGWEALYDNQEKTGLIVILAAETKVRALWGADASNCHTADNVKAGMLAAGCTGGCDEVIIKHWPK